MFLCTYASPRLLQCQQRPQRQHKAAYDGALVVYHSLRVPPSVGMICYESGPASLLALGIFSCASSCKFFVSHTHQATHCMTCGFTSLRSISLTHQYTSCWLHLLRLHHSSYTFLDSRAVRDQRRRGGASAVSRRVLCGQGQLCGGVLERLVPHAQFQRGAQPEVSASHCQIPGVLVETVCLAC